MTAVGPFMAVAPELASQWSRSAATAAACVPAEGDEAAAWTVRGWTEVALGCTVLGLPDAFSGLDEVVRQTGIRAAGRFASRLRRLRSAAGGVPWFYPAADEAPGGPAARPARPLARRAGRALTAFCDMVGAACHQLAEPAAATAARGPQQVAQTGADQLGWGAAHRPGPVGEYPVVRCAIDRDLVWRTWMSLPGDGGPRLILVEVPSPVPARRQRLWRGLHDGAHFDHMAALCRLAPTAPSPAEFGSGLLAAEAYAMAVEILATVEFLLAGDADVALELRDGLLERVGRVRPGPVAEFLALPRLAESYVLGPLRLLAGGGGGPLLPPALLGPLRERWGRACDAFPPAARLTAVAGRLQ
jgi:hypothetical protein